MSEEEINDIKEHFINEYKANGGNADLSGENIKFIMTKVESQKEIKALKDELAKKNTPSQQSKFNGMKSGLDEGKYNASLASEFAKIYGSYQDYVDPPFDIRQIDDESFKRDNSLNALAEDPNLVCILRDNAGRCDAGGPTKYKKGVAEW
jgi:hypothetical protein